MIEEILSLFPDARVSSGYIRIRCPYHKDGKERRPSMSILLEERGGLSAGMCHCFACGKKISLTQLLQDMGVNAVLQPASLATTGVKLAPIKTYQPLFKPQLPYRFSAYLAGRGIGAEIQEKFRIYEKDGLVHMPVFNRSGEYLYDNARATTTKLFSVEEAANKTLWGIEEIDFTRPMAICESQIDGLSFWEAGIQAVATLGADNVESVNVLKDSVSTFILAFDPDTAGRRATEKVSSILGKWRCSYLDLPNKDINQLWQELKNVKKFKLLLEKCERFYEL